MVPVQADKAELVAMGGLAPRKCHKIFNKYFNLLEWCREGWWRGNGCWGLAWMHWAENFRKTAPSAITVKHLKCFISIFSNKAILLALENCTTKSQARRRQGEAWGMRHEARGSCNKNYDDFLIKPEKRQQNSPATTTITSFVAKWKTKIVQIRALSFAVNDV